MARLSISHRERGEGIGGFCAACDVQHVRQFPQVELVLA